MKKFDKDDVIAAIVVVVPIILMLVITVCLNAICIKTNSPFWILIDMSTGKLFGFFLFAAVILIWCWKEIFDSPEPGSIIHHPLFWKILAGTIAIIFIPQLFTFSGKYSFIEVDGSKPIALKYKYYLLKDAITGETETMTLDANEFELDSHTYTTRSGRGHSHRTTVYYARYGDNSMYLYKYVLNNYIKVCREDNRTIDIEYYKNSGIIKSIDGAMIYDENTIALMAGTIEGEMIKKQAEEEKHQNEEKERDLALFSAFFESEGKNFKTILKQLKSQGIENTYSVRFISTQYYDTGAVAFFDNMQNVVYVAHGNDKEDMVEVPPLPYNGTLEEITKILDNAGIKWTYDCFGYRGDKDKVDHSKDTLRTVHCSPGTPIPKDYVFWFSVDHAD